MGKITEQDALTGSESSEGAASTPRSLERLTMAIDREMQLDAGRIEKTLREQPGVHAVSVSLPDGQAVIEYDRARVGPDELIGKLRDLGVAAEDHRAAQDSDGEIVELRREGRRLIALTGISAVTVPLMFVEMWGGAGAWVGWVIGALAVAVFAVAPKLVVLAVNARRTGFVGQPFVVQASAFGGFAGGVIGLVARPEDYPTGGFFAVTVLVVAYYVFSRWFALLVRTGSSQSVRKLLELQPDRVRLIRDGEEHVVPLEALQVGDRVRVRPGERVPIDGRVVTGRSAVDESLVTGESMPEAKREGDDVIGGSMNGSGTLLVEVTRVGEDTFLQQVIHTIEDARALKPGVLDLVARVLKVYMPSVLVLAVLAAAFWIVYPAVRGEGADLNRAVFATLSVLIMAYPCAMGLAAPLVLVRGAGEAAQHGIILRTGDAFQVFDSVKRIVFDKTGTLTEGKFSVRELEALGDPNELLALAAAAEASSEHPIGSAIVAAARERGLPLAPVRDFEALSGNGVHATVDGAAVLVGRPSFVAAQGKAPERFAQRVAELEEAGRTVVAVSRGGEVLGLIALGDQIRPEARDALAEMKRQGISPVLLTGDNRRAAERVARQLGIDDVYAEVLPKDKVDVVRELQRKGRVAMVGDGINDAPALTQADVGIAMGSGTDVAIESADVIIVGNRIDAVLSARDIGRRSYRRTKQNVVLAFVFNAIGVPIAATGLLYPIWAMVVMIVSVTAVLVNSMWGQWSLVISTLRDVAQRKVQQPSSTPSA